MTKRKTLGRKPHAVTPLCSRALGFGAAFAAAVLCGTAQARVAYSIDGTVLTITASSTYSGKAIQLLWGETATEGVYANTNTVCDAVASSGGRYSFDLKEAGVQNGTELHLWVCHRYQILDKMYQPSTLYVNTGIKDSDVYGVRFGFCLEQTFTSDATFRNVVGTGASSVENTNNTIPSGSSFTVGFRQHSTEGLKLYYESRGSAGDRFPVAEGEMLDIAFTNSVLTIGGVSKKQGLDLSPVGHVSDYTNRTMLVGRYDNPNISGGRAGQGWWSYVQFDDEDGNLIVDYVPVKDCATGTIGFFDRAAETLGMVTVSGSGSFATASSGSDKKSEPTGEYIETDFEDLGQTIIPNRELTYTVDRSELTVTVPDGLIGEQLYLLWDDEDRGDDPTAWAYCEKIESSVRLGKLGVKNGQYIRIAAANCYKELETLQMSGAATSVYVDSGIRDSDVYGVRFGFYSPTLTEAFATIIGTQENAFLVSVSNQENAKWLICYHKKDAVSRPSVKTDAINEIEFAGRKCVLNGVTLSSALAAGPVGESGRNIQIGRGQLPSSSGGFFYRRCNGYWSHVSFDDADGNRILDYIPVQRVASDGTLGKVGFYDRATKSFVTSTGTGEFTAGAVKEDKEVVSYNSVSAATRVTGIPGFVIMFR